MIQTPLLEVKNLYAGVPEKEILKDLSLCINKGEVHALMGPNGAGKSTLSYVLAGKPDYTVTKGSIFFKGKDFLPLKPDERAHLGLFLSMQSPVAIAGVSCSNFLKHAVNAKRKAQNLPELDAAEFLKLLREKAKELNISGDMLKREMNVGFSGGEKKRLEALQMSLLQPDLAILDETDSGLDVDAVRIVAESVNRLRAQDTSLLIITHHIKLLTYLQPDVVHVYNDGHILCSGNMALAQEIENHGYTQFTEAK